MNMKELLHKLCYLPRHQYRKECVMYLAHIFPDGTLFFLDCSSTLRTPPFEGIREATLEEIKVAYETECRYFASDGYDFQG